VVAEYPALFHLEGRAASRGEGDRRGKKRGPDAKNAPSCQAGLRIKPEKGEKHAAPRGGTS